MSVQNTGRLNSVFMALRGGAPRKVRQVTEPERQEAREAFYKALRACDKASERMMDKHLESVAESAKKQAEYRRKKAVADRAMSEADERRALNEVVLIERINHQNMLEEARIRDLRRKELLEEGNS
ncbi:MAG: hypothetical protein LBR87_07945 [Synergistaceae bacterium]|jgi:hypothetical protein|nr:hypothetical protein [Synergistaceae bacterium]